MGPAQLDGAGGRGGRADVARPLRPGWLLTPATAVALITDGRGRPAFRVTAPIPPDAPATALGEHPPRYWELDLAVARPGVDYGARFLVPVY